MAIDLTTNRIGSSLTGVSDATILDQYIQAGIQETYRTRNVMGQFFTDISDTMRDVEVGYTHRNKSSFTVKGDVTVSVNQVQYETVPGQRGSPSIDRVRHAWESEKNWAYANADITQQQMAESPIDILTITSAAMGADVAAQIDTYREACLAGALPTTGDQSVTSDEATYWNTALDSVDNLDGTTTTDQSQFLGSSSNYIPLDGREKGTSNIMLTLLEDLQLRWEIANKAGYAAGGDLVFTMLTHPSNFFALERSVDELGNNVYEIERIEGGEKRLWFGNIQVVSSNRIKERNVSETTGKVVASGGKKALPVHLIANGALGYAERFDTTMRADPGVNQTGPYTRIDFSRQRQAWLLDPRLWERRWIPTEARS